MSNNQQGTPNIQVRASEENMKCFLSPFARFAHLVIGYFPTLQRSGWDIWCSDVLIAAYRSSIPG